MVFELDLLSKTVLALEQRLSHSENKMNEVIDYLSAVDTQGKQRLISTSAVIHTSTLLKDMPAQTLMRTCMPMETIQTQIKVGPNDPVDEEFMRQTNQFIKIN